ncbi:hypothetical protein GL177_20435 [Vibrio toranzoniae]|uniref:hypothetical protein n=1 Tax=Vibrio toranzoniae TaxID=1194427 RepID=UPI00137866FE|nr:hypothetical protein [Vibrio toranzoniae]NAZ55668.1 hypothetical protein [Vibrio toranzoniae]
MSFAELMRDKVDLIKANGQRVEGIQASVQKKLTIIERDDILIEPGDLLERKASNGSVSVYKVIDPGFTESHGIGFPAHYQIKHQNLSVEEVKELPQNVTYNFGSISAEQMQVGNNNTQNVTINVQELVKKVVESDDEEAKSKLKSLLENSTVASVVGAGISGLISLL